MVIVKQGLLIVEVEIRVAVVVVVVVVFILLPDFIHLKITSNGNKTANIYVKNCTVYTGYSVRVHHSCRYKTAQITI